MTIHFLQNIFEKSINGEWGNEDSGNGEATAVIRTSNFLNSGRLNLDNIVCREIDKDKNSDKILRTGDIIIEKSGGSPNQPVGRVVYFDVTDQDYFTNNFTSILRVKPGYNSKYIFYLMKYLYDTKKVLKFQNQTTGIINLKLTDYLNKTKVNIETIENQNTIVSILDRLEYQIINRNKQLSELSNLVKSRFNEMFGDPVLNEMGWEKHRLSKLTLKIGSGATPRGGRESYVNEGIALIRSMNVYDGKFILKDLAYLTNVQAEKLNNVIVESDDVLLNITGASVSRCCIVPQIILPARVNQHVSIIRCKKHLLSPIFLNQLLITSEFKSLLQKIGESSGATRQAITKNQIEELTIPLPPLSLQNEFADFVGQVDKSQFACQKAIKLWRNSLKSSII